MLDGLLYHESDLRIEEHYTDTAGFTDHVFGLCHLLGFRFAPRIRDLADRRLYVTDKAKLYPRLLPFIGGTIKVKQILAQWPEILRLASSIRLGTVTSSLILRKLASYPRQNGLAVALREFGRIERTLFTLDWLLDKNLRQRVTAGLNKGELKIRWPRPSVSIVWVKCAIAALKHNIIVQAASILWWPQSSCGTPFISNWRSEHFASKGAKLTTAYSSMWRPSIGTTST